MSRRTCTHSPHSLDLVPVHELDCMIRLSLGQRPCDCQVTWGLVCLDCSGEAEADERTKDEAKAAVARALEVNTR